MKATLYNKTHAVLDVELECGRVTGIGELHDPLFLPLILQHDLGLRSVNSWLSARRIPQEREGLAQLPPGLRDKGASKRMFSLTDQYWFSLGEADTWEEYNFFTNRYSNSVGLAQFTPWAVDAADMEADTPDATTNGFQRKMWEQDEDLVSYLCKARSEEYAAEPLCEVLASMLLSKLDLVPFVEYRFAIRGMRLCSVCRCFVDADTEFIPAMQFYVKEPKKAMEPNRDHLVKMLESYGITGSEDYLDRMIFADTLIGNKDRHMGNFGILRDIDSRKFLGFAPVFDFGSAFSEYSACDGVKRKSIEEQKRFGGSTSGAIRALSSPAVLRALEDDADMRDAIASYPFLSPEEKAEVLHGMDLRRDKIRNEVTFSGQRP